MSISSSAARRRRARRAAKRAEASRLGPTPDNLNLFSQPKYPPPDELRNLYRVSLPVDRCPKLGAWLRKVGLDPCRVADVPLVRALPHATPCPTWAQSNGVLWNSGDALLVWLHDRNGQVRSVCATSLNSPPSELKHMLPDACSVADLILACPLAQLALSRSLLGDGSFAFDCVARVGIVIAIGVIHWLRCVTSFSAADEDAPAVIGLLSAATTTSLITRLPERCIVTLASSEHPAANTALEALQALHKIDRITLTPKTH